MIEFNEFPKIPRLHREVVVTEKLDGTNASITIVAADTDEAKIAPFRTAMVSHGDGTTTGIYDIFAGSRSRFITPDADNYGFARWVRENALELVRLGVGTHYGEWWGLGINRGYGLKEKRFSLFNVTRWEQERPDCCGVVPVILRGQATDGFDVVKDALAILERDGSVAAPGFMQPEGIIAFHTQGNLLFKATLLKDQEYKGKL